MTPTQAKTGNRGVTIWLTGLSGSGKTTIATALAERLTRQGMAVEILDGDEVRRNLSADLGFSAEDREKHNKRVIYVSKLLMQSGITVIVPLISPYRAVREFARKELGRFVEVYVECPLEECIRRDVKGLYAKALRGEIQKFTGVSDPYEAPDHPEVLVRTDKQSLDECVERVLDAVSEKGYLASGSPHGGVLVDRRVSGDDARALREEASRLPGVALDAFGLNDLYMISSGAFSPLRGFMDRNDYDSVLENMRLSSGLVWSLPVTLPVTAEESKRLGGAARVALRDAGGRPVAVLDLNDIFQVDRKKEARLAFGTEEEAHPGVAALYKRPDARIAGRVSVFEDIAPREFADEWHEPRDTRAIFQKRGWKTVVGFQTRNPVHRAHEYIQKCALEICDGLLLHPLVGETKAGDIPADLRMRSYRAILQGYYPRDRVLLSVLPAYMRYAGPREAIFHALVRKNYGCTHFIVGRDHAGVGSYYGTYDAQHIFQRFAPADLGITPLFFENSFYCRECGNMASSKTCPHDASRHLTLSGTKVREMLEKGELPPAEFSRPEVARVLTDGAKAATR